MVFLKVTFVCNGVSGNVNPCAQVPPSAENAHTVSHRFNTTASTLDISTTLLQVDWIFYTCILCWCCSSAFYSLCAEVTEQFILIKNKTIHQTIPIRQCSTAQRCPRTYMYNIGLISKVLSQVKTTEVYRSTCLCPFSRFK